MHFTFMDGVILSTVVGLVLGAQETSRRWEPHLINIVLAIFIPWLLGMVLGAILPQFFSMGALDLAGAVTGSILGYLTGMVVKYIKEQALRY